LAKELPSADADAEPAARHDVLNGAIALLLGDDQQRTEDSLPRVGVEDGRGRLPGAVGGLAVPEAQLP
jgi:hypothetical protein